MNLMCVKWLCKSLTLNIMVITASGTEPVPVAGRMYGTDDVCWGVDSYFFPVFILLEYGPYIIEMEFTEFASSYAVT